MTHEGFIPVLPATIQRDPPLKDSRLRIRVKVRPINTSFRRAGDDDRDNIVPQGVSEQVIYKCDLEQIMKSKVETDESRMLLAAAKRTHEGARRQFVREQLRIANVPEDESLWDDKMRKAAWHYTGSVEGEFYRMAGYAVKPIESLEVLEELPPIMTDSERSVHQLASMQTEMMASALKQALASQAPQTSQRK